MPLELGANFGVNLDILGVAQTIASAVTSEQNRDGFVKNLMESTSFSTGQQYNVMVFNLSQDYEEKFNGIVFYGSAVYTGGITYGIWAFEDGEFTNKGDGGWINWAFKGWFDRDGSHVKFKKPLNAQGASTFAASCTDISINGAQLSATCTKKNGTSQRTSIIIKGVHNQNGQLVQGNLNEESTFNQTCTDISINGDQLSANCRTSSGGNQHSSVTLLGIHNNDGNLTY
jgi:hypothetical protein